MVVWIKWSVRSIGLGKSLLRRKDLYAIWNVFLEILFLVKGSLRSFRIPWGPDLPGTDAQVMCAAHAVWPEWKLSESRPKKAKEKEKKKGRAKDSCTADARTSSASTVYGQGLSNHVSGGERLTRADLSSGTERMGPWYPSTSCFWYRRYCVGGALPQASCTLLAKFKTAFFFSFCEICMAKTAKS